MCILWFHTHDEYVSVDYNRQTRQTDVSSEMSADANVSHDVRARNEYVSWDDVAIDVGRQCVSRQIRRCVGGCVVDQLMRRLMLLSVSGLVCSYSTSTSA